MMRFSFTISHVPGKSLLVADALSRAPCSDPVDEDTLLQQETAVYVNTVVQSLPVTERQLERIRQHQKEDEVCQQVAAYCQSGWPSRQTIAEAVRHYYPVAAELSVENGLLMQGSRIVKPAALWLEMLDRIHTGHQGITKCRERARQSIWWPGLSKQLEMVKCCTECCKVQTQRFKPLIPSCLPELPWQKFGTDLFEWKQNTYVSSHCWLLLSFHWDFQVQSHNCRWRHCAYQKHFHQTRNSWDHSFWELTPVLIRR